VKGPYWSQNVVSVTSVNASQSAVALAERKVQQDRDRVAQDEDRLDESRSVLAQDNQSLSKRQLDNQRTQAASAPRLSTPKLDNAIDKKIPQDLLPRPPTLNALGQTIGKLIHVVA
jgi:hypothetical protein